MKTMPTKWTILLAFAGIYIIWGSTYIAILVGLEGLPPFLLSALRFLLAGALLFAWCLVKKERLPSWKDIGKNTLCGVLMLFGGTVSVTWAEQYISSSLAAIIVTSLPFWFVLLDRQQWSFYFSRKIIIAGLLIGFAGVILLVSVGQQEQHSVQQPGYRMIASLVIVAGGISWAAGSLISRYRPASTGLLMNGSVQLLSTGILTLIVSGAAGEFGQTDWQAVPAASWSAMCYLAIMGSLCAYLSYLYLIKIRPAAQVSTYVYVNPVIAVLLGAVIMNEPVTWLQVLALLIILVGVLLVNLHKYRGFRTGIKT